MPCQSRLNVIWECAVNRELLTWFASHGVPRHTWALKRYIRELPVNTFCFLSQLWNNQWFCWSSKTGYQKVKVVFSKGCLYGNRLNTQLPFRVPPHTGKNTLTKSQVISQLRKETKGIDGLRLLHVHGHTLCSRGRGLGAGFCPLCIFKLNRMYAIISYNSHTIHEWTSLKSSYNKSPRRMEHNMLKFFANSGRVHQNVPNVIRYISNRH